MKVNFNLKVSSTNALAILTKLQDAIYTAKASGSSEELEEILTAMIDSGTLSIEDGQSVLAAATLAANNSNRK